MLPLCFPYPPYMLWFAVYGGLPLLFGSPYDLRAVYREDRGEELTGGLEVGRKDWRLEIGDW